MPDSQTSQNQLADENLSLYQQASEQPNDSPMVAKVEQGMMLQLADGIIQACNPTAESILGITTKGLIGCNLLDPIWQAICEDGSPFPGDSQPPMVALRTGKPCLNVVIGLSKPSGELVWLLLDSQPLFQIEGTIPYAVVTTFTDITALKRGQVELNNILEKEDARRRTEVALLESEKRYRLLAEAIPEIVFSTDAEGRADYVNQRWHQYTGLTLEETVGYGWLKTLHPDDVKIIVQPWQEALQNKILYENEHRFRRASDSTYRWHLVRGFPLKDDNERVIKWFGTCTDIHAQKQLEEERKQMLEREKAARNAAEDANRIKDQFLAILSHELRSPLNPILGWTKLLKSRKFDEVVTSRALDTIERNAKLQIQLIDDLLDVSRILRSKLSLNVAAVDLPNAINAALETVRLAAEAKSIDLRFSILDGNGALGNEQSTNSQSNIQNPKFLVAGDAYRLQQVVGNLLSNAVKFTPTGGRVEVRLSVVEGSREWGRDVPPERLYGSREESPLFAQITVIDTGSGISPDFLPHVFEYFRQADSSTTRKFGGLGLGLAIVRHLVELHGGTATADSPGEGKGATFTVRLPLMKTASELNQDNSRAFTCPNLQGLKILIVDDDADTRELLKFLLEQYGAITITATSATEAYAALSKSKMDLLLSDLGMPETDGYDLIRQIRAMPPELGGDILAIALTAYAHQTDQERVFAAGFQKHLAKPVEPEKLLASIADLVGQKCDN